MTTEATRADTAAARQTQANQSQASWQEQALKIDITLGEYRLLRPTVRAATWQGPAYIDEQAPSEKFWGDFPEAVQALFIHSQPVDAPLPHVARLPAAIRHVTCHFNRHYVDLRGTFDEYLMGLSQKTRGNLRRAVRKFAEACGGSIDCRVYRTPQEMKEFYEFSRRCSQRTWQERQYNRGIPDERRFVDRMLEYALAGRVRGTVLFLHGEPAAFAYDVATGRTMLGDVTGYDPRHGKLSPGMVVHYMVLEAMFADGRYDVFDFGPGDEHFKSLLATRTQFCADIYYFRPTLRNRLLVGGQRSLFALNHAAGAALGRLHLREPLKIAMHATMKIGKRIARAGRGRHACDVPQASREPASAGQERSPV